MLDCRAPVLCHSLVDLALLQQHQVSLAVACVGSMCLRAATACGASPAVVANSPGGLLAGPMGRVAAVSTYSATAAVDSLCMHLLIMQGGPSLTAGALKAALC